MSRRLTITVPPECDGRRIRSILQGQLGLSAGLVTRLRHREGVEYVAVSQNSIPYIDGSNSFNLRIDSVLTYGMLLVKLPV